jgi:hypothetical protein
MIAGRSFIDHLSICLTLRRKITKCRVSGNNYPLPSPDCLAIAVLYAEGSGFSGPIAPAVSRTAGSPTVVWRRPYIPRSLECP